jgi:6-phosphogluconolactonase
MDDAHSVVRAAAELVAALSREPVMTRGRFSLALSGGSTPLPVYRLLASPPYALAIPWDRVHVYWCDERCVPADDPESNYGQVRQALIAPLDLPNARVHRIRGELSPEAAAADYIGHLSLHSQDNLRWPVFDLAMLGLGRDGHTASLFPGQAVPAHVPAAAVTANYDSRPADRVTLTPSALNSSRHVLFLAVGTEKAEAIAATLDGPHDPEHWPAQRIQPEHGTITWMIDRLAASKLHRV